MEISNRGIDLIKEFEGFSSKPYLCPAGVPTIGYGSTQYEDGVYVSLNDPPISVERATQILKHSVSVFGKTVERYTKVPLAQHQFDALVSFSYNVGTQAFKNSSLLKFLNMGRYDLAAKQFGKWIYAGKRILKGLVNRREKERKLFLGID